MFSDALSMENRGSMRDGAPRRMKVAPDDVGVWGMAQHRLIKGEATFLFSMLHTPWL